MRVLTATRPPAYVTHETRAASAGKEDAITDQDRHEKHGRGRWDPAYQRRAGPHHGLRADQQNWEQPVVVPKHGCLTKGGRPGSG